MEHALVMGTLCPPERSHVYLQIALVNNEIGADMLHEFCFADHFTGALNEQCQDVVCPAADANRRITSRQRLAFGYKHERPEGVRRVALGFKSTH